MKSSEEWSLQLWSQAIAINAIAQRILKKIQYFNEVWARDLTILVQCPNQLSYEAIDVESRSVVGSYVQLVRASHRYREVTGSNPIEVLNFFQASLCNWWQLQGPFFT